MSVKLIAYSVIQVAPPEYKTPYGVGMVEDQGGKTVLVRIKQDYLNMLRPALEGEIRKETVDSQELNFFYPE